MAEEWFEAWVDRWSLLVFPFAVENDAGIRAEAPGDEEAAPALGIMLLFGVAVVPLLLHCADVAMERVAGAPPAGAGVERELERLSPSNFLPPRC